MNNDNDVTRHEFAYMKDFLYYVWLISDDVQNEVKKQYREFYREFRAGITDKSSYQKKKGVIEALEKALSKEIIEIVKNHSTLFWMQFLENLISLEWAFCSPEHQHMHLS